MANKIKGDNYERHVLMELKNDHDDIWLWKEIPEKILFDHGIILDYDEFCQTRQDIGIDVVGLKGDKLYFYQCKNHQDIIVLDRITGMLFFGFSRSVDVTLCYSNTLSKFITKTLDVWKDKMVLKINLMHIPYENIEINNNVREQITVLEPRKYQLDAVKSLTGFHRGLLATPCGTGKTYTSSLIAKKYDNIIIFAPLRELASNLLNTYYNYLDDIELNKILVSSDSTATRDFGKILDSLTYKNIIASTYASADIIIKLLDHLDNPLIIIDEFHNLSDAQLTNKTNHMNKILNSTHKILFLSATPTNRIKFDKVYRMDWNVAVKKGLICDFNMIIPTGDIMNDEKLDTFIGTLEDIGEINDKTKILIKQAYFLLRSLKYNGNKKCIAFFTTIESTNIFESIVTQLSALCNIDIDVQTIVNNATHKQRAERIKLFRDSDKLSILLSVHILDEGIDIPQCDSIFVASPNHDIDNLIQRLSRCNRIINEKTKAYMYLWCGYRKIKDILDQINKKFTCTIPENISTLNVESNKIITKPSLKYGTKNINNLFCNAISDDGNLWCDIKNISNVFGTDILTECEINAISHNNVRNIVDIEYEQNEIVTENNNVYVSIEGIYELLKIIFPVKLHGQKDKKIRIINMLLTIIVNYDSLCSVVKFINMLNRRDICINFDILKNLLNFNENTLKNDMQKYFKLDIGYTITKLNNNVMITPHIFDYLCIITMSEEANKLRKEHLKVGKQSQIFSKKISIEDEIMNINIKPKNIKDEYMHFYDMCKYIPYGISLDCVLKYLDIKLLNKFYDKFRKKYTLNKDYIIVRNKNKCIKNVRNAIYYISFNTFNKICMATKSKKGDAIRDYLISLNKCIQG